MRLRDRMRRSPRLTRVMFNLWPCIRGTGGRVAYIAPDWSEVRIRLPLNWRTRNYVGTIFGGSLYAAVDPFLMLMLLERLGPGHVVWDKAASVRFVRPGTRTLHATCRIDDAELAAVRTALEQGKGQLDRTYGIELVDDDGVVYARIEKVVYVATKEAHAVRRSAGRGGTPAATEAATDAGGGGQARA